MGAIPKLTVSSGYAESQIQTLASYGYPKSRACHHLQITGTQLNSPRFRLSVERLMALYEDAEIQLDDPLIGLRVGHDFRVTSFAKSGSMYSFCDDIAHVIAVNKRYQPLAITAGDVDLVRDGQRPCLQWTPYHSDAHDYRHISGLLMGAYGSAFRWLTWATGKGLKAVYLRREAPENLEFVDSVFRCHVTFGSAHNRIEFFPDTFAAPLTTRDAERLAFFEARLDQVLNADNRAQGLEVATKIAIYRAIRYHRITFEDVAELMDVPPRKLRRRLAAEALKFRDLLGACRQDMAQSQMEKGISLTQIAQNLGYSDQAAFTRAFRRWHGMSPRDYLRAKGNGSA